MYGYEARPHWGVVIGLVVGGAAVLLYNRRRRYYHEGCALRACDVVQGVGLATFRAWARGRAGLAADSIAWGHVASGTGCKSRVASRHRTGT